MFMIFRGTFKFVRIWAFLYHEFCYFFNYNKKQRNFAKNAIFVSQNIDNEGKKSYIHCRMKPITDYVDYRRYMQDFYDERKRTSAFTWREFARLAGFVSPTYLKLVCEGKTRLKNDGVERTALAMRLVGYEVDYFRMMVRYAHVKTDYERKKAYDEMQSIAGEHKVKIVDEDAFAYFETWKNPVIRELAPIMPGAKPGDIAKLCCQGVSAGDVRESLGFMTKAGLLKKDRSGRYAQTDKALRGDSEVMPVAIRSMHRDMAKFGLAAIDDFALSDRNISGVTMGVDRAAY